MGRSASRALLGVGIGVGSLGFLGAAVGVGFGAAALAEGVASNLGAAIAAPPDDLPPVEYYSAEEAGFWFAAALEVYHDDRLGGCPAEFERGCWQAALIPEGPCDLLSIDYSFSNDPESPFGEETRSTNRTDVEAGEPIELVFGNDRYEYGWVSAASCIESSKPTAPPAEQPPAPPAGSTAAWAPGAPAAPPVRPS